MTTRRALLFGLLTTPVIARAEILDFVPRGPVLNPDHGPLRRAYNSLHPELERQSLSINGWTKESVRRVSKSGNRFNLSIRQSPLPLKGDVTTLTAGPPRLSLSELRSGNYRM